MESGVDERVTTADYDLWYELLDLDADLGVPLDGGTDSHRLDKAAADFVDEDFHADDGIGAEGGRFIVDVGQLLRAS